MSLHWRIEPLGEDALLLRLGEGIDTAINAQVHLLAAQVAAARPQWLREIVPAYATLAIGIDLAALGERDDPLAIVERWLRSLGLDRDDTDAGTDAPLHNIAVHYGGEHGPDLDAVAAHAGISATDVVARHCAGEYHVAMLGFAAGFPYLLGMDASLAMPRLATPRMKVAAGSVGIAGAQTGIYPRAGPGGWRIIGRSDATLFNATRTPPTLLAPGDRVRFIDAGTAA